MNAEACGAMATFGLPLGSHSGYQLLSLGRFVYGLVCRIMGHLGDLKASGRLCQPSETLEWCLGGIYQSLCNRVKASLVILQGLWEFLETLGSLWDPLGACGICRFWYLQELL